MRTMTYVIPTIVSHPTPDDQLDFALRKGIFFNKKPKIFENRSQKFSGEEARRKLYL